MINTLPPEQLIEILAKTDRSSAFFVNASKVLDTALAPGGFPTTEPVDRSKPKLLSIGMATYDDYDGVYFSIQAIRLYHPEVTNQTEILVIDNHPDGPEAEALRRLQSNVANCRYVPVAQMRGTAVRDLIFREASGEFVLSMDSHVLFVPGSLAKLLDYLEEHPKTNDLLQGPLVADNLTDISTHFEPKWSEAMWGVWERDERGVEPAATPFEIPMQGLGVFGCRRGAWPGFNPRLRGFGGEEGYLHEKFRRAGARNLCLPFLRWIHRFDRPRGVTYSLSWEDRVRNYLVAFDELGLDPTPVVEHFRELLGAEATDRMVASAREEIAGPFHFFDAIYCINLDRDTDRWESANRQFQQLGIADRVRRFRAIETSVNHHIGCALSHRAIVAEAKKHGLRNVLVFEDDIIFAPYTLEVLSRSLAELRRQSWGILYLGGHTWGCSFDYAPGCRYLQVPEGLTCTHALAYHESVYDCILAAVPETPSGLALWLKTHYGIDQFYAGSLGDRLLVTKPMIVTQPNLIFEMPC